MPETILVSSCLLGKNCRYDGSSKANPEVIKLSDSYHIVDICPEESGGFSTPRQESQIVDGDGMDVLDESVKVLHSKSGKDVTHKFIIGAEKALEKAIANNVKYAILKERSPSCGVSQIYRNDKVVFGMGVTTALLLKNGIKVYSEERLPDFTNDDG